MSITIDEMLCGRARMRLANRRGRHELVDGRKRLTERLEGEVSSECARAYWAQEVE